jgi:hypothetical protein
MNSSQSWFSLAIPTGWADVIIRAVKAAIVAFVVLQLKEWFDAGTFDTPATAADAALIAGGTIVLNVILRLIKS